MATEVEREGVGSPTASELLARARGLRGRARAAALADWERALTAQRETGPGRAEQAADLREALSMGDLESLAGWRGRTARSIAVEAMLALGFPHALEVHPEELAHLREVQARGVWGADLQGLRACLGLSLGGQAALWTAWGAGGAPEGLVDGAALVAGVMAPLMAGGWMAFVRLWPRILHPHVRPVD